MPKVIDDAKLTIISVATKELFEKGYQKLTIRDVAKKCNIATGTIYNYFPSKDMLVAAIMIDDWMKAMGKIDIDLSNTFNIEVGIKAIYDNILLFSKTFSVIWDQYSIASNFVKMFQERHLVLRKQIEDKLNKFFAKNNQNLDSDDIMMIAEIIILGTNQKDLKFETIMKTIQKILTK